MKITYGKPDNRSQFEKNIETAKQEMETFFESSRMRASIAKVQYEALISEGFTKTQAMQILLEHPDWKG